MFASSIRALLCSVTELIFLSLIKIIRSFISKPTSAAILCELTAVILGITLYCSPWFKNNNKKNENINFCSSYHNPYEVALGSDKVIGLALKKTKYWIVFQGVIHMSKTADYFKDFTNYDQYFTNGILSKAKVESELLYHEILSQLTHLKLI